MPHIVLVLAAYCLFASMATANTGLSRMVVGENHVATYEQRVGWIRNLSTAALERDRALLTDFLMRPLAADRATEDELATLKNDVADRLLGARPGDATLHAALLGVYEAEDQGTVWPGYVLQKLPRIVRQTPDDAVRQASLERLWEEARAVDSPESPTAMICLHWLWQDGDFVERDELAALLLANSENTEAALPTRTTALEYAARLGEDAAKAQAETYLKTYQPAPLKAAALGVYSLMGEPGDVALLKPYTRSLDLRVRTAAIHAIEAIRTR